MSKLYDYLKRLMKSKNLIKQSYNELNFVSYLLIIVFLIGCGKSDLSSEVMTQNKKHAPQAHSIVKQVQSNQSVFIHLSSLYVDLDGDELKYTTINQLPKNGSLSLIAPDTVKKSYHDYDPAEDPSDTKFFNNFRVQYTPNSNFTGEDTFNYQVFSKDGLQSEIATISLLVSKGETQEKDNPPVAHDLIITTQVKQMVYIDTQSITFDQDGDIVETTTAHDRGRAHFLTMNYGIVEGGSRWITYLPKSTGIEKIHYEAFNLSPQEKTKGKGIITIHVVNATKST